MSNSISFAFDGVSVRVISDNPDRILFVAKDVAQALGYARPNDAIQQFCKGAVNRRPLQTEGGVQEVRVIEEPDVYRLIFGSRLESAQKFQDWVFEEVLPQIRNTGAYRATLTPAQQRAVQEAVAAKVAREGVSFQAVYQALKSRYRIPRYDLLAQGDFAGCLAWLGAQDADYARRHQVAAVALMERGLQQHREHAEVVRALWMRIADLGGVARHVSEELLAMRAVLQYLDKSGAIFDGLHEAQAHLGFSREVLDAGRALAEGRR